MTLRNKILIHDMLDTMYDYSGVGLAAPQVGILKRIVVVDVSEAKEEQEKQEKPEGPAKPGGRPVDSSGGPYVLVNPEIVEAQGEQTGEEGCLSVPGKYGIVTRPAYVKIRAMNEDMEEIEVEAEGLLARAFCHEIDHLDGRMYVDLVKDGLRNVEENKEI